MSSAGRFKLDKTKATVLAILAGQEKVTETAELGELSFEVIRTVVFREVADMKAYFGILRYILSFVMRVSRFGTKGAF